MNHLYLPPPPTTSPAVVIFCFSCFVRQVMPQSSVLDHLSSSCWQLLFFCCCIFCSEREGGFPNRFPKPKPKTDLRKKKQKTKKQMAVFVFWNAADILLGSGIKNESLEGSSFSSQRPLVQIPELIPSLLSFLADTSYEKACRRGSAPTTPILGSKQHQTEHNATSRFTNFFSKK